MLMERMSPSTSQLYIADADGSNERLLLRNNSLYDYHASFSADGEYITFTTERNGDGNSDVYLVHKNGTGLKSIVTTPAVEDTVAISPDGKSAVYASTADGILHEPAACGDSRPKLSRTKTPFSPTARS